MWTVEFLDEKVETLFESFPEDVQASFKRITRLIQSSGLEQVREPYVKHLQGRLWEMRLKGRAGIARAVYVTAVGKRIVVCTSSSRKPRRRRAAKSK